jgi:hypothetical protein
MLTLESLLVEYNRLYKIKPIKKIKMSSSCYNLIADSFTLYKDDRYQYRNEFMGVRIEIDDTILNWKIEE